MRVFGKEYASAYDYLYQDKNYENECDFIETAFKKYSGNVKKILDLGCGTGSHALILAKRGYKIVGIDQAKDMLETAKSKAANENLPIEFIKDDITNINLKENFDAVISMFAVMSYQTTNSALARAFKVAREHLIPGGIFLFDCWYGPAVISERPTVRIKEIEINKKEKIIRFTEPILNISLHTVETRFKVWKIQDNYIVDEINETHFMRFLFPQEIKYFLEMSGFNKIEFCPFLEFEKPLTEKDWNMVVIAKAK